MQITFKGKTALIVGGTSFLSQLLCKKLIEEGINVTATYRNEKSLVGLLSDDLLEYQFLDLETTVISESLVKCYDYVIDISHTNFEALIASENGKSLANYFTHNISVKAELLSKLSRLMIKNRFGKFIYLSSTSAELINPGQAFYSASKNACESIFKGIGVELGKKGITSLILRAGYINHGRGKDYIENNSDLIKKRVPTRTVLEPEEVVDSLMFYLSDSAKSYNATVVTLDGGMTACK